MPRNHQPLHPIHTWRDRITAARTGLLLNSPFFGQLSVMLKVEANDDFDTMATDGKYLYVSPKFVSTLQNSELIFAMAHEVLHVSNNHHTRRQNRDPELWNIACDFAINDILYKCKFNMPDWVCYDPKYSGMHAEEIYAILLDEAESHCARNNQKMIGDVIDATNNDGTQATQADMERIEQENNITTQQAANAAELAGKMPDHLKRMITQVTEPKHDWRKELRNFIDDNTITDTTWSRPRRRNFALDPDIIFPGKIPDGMAHLCLIIDTSGSIDSKTLAEFASEIQDITSLNRVSQTTVMYADATVNHIDQYQLGETIELTPHGGGGTDFADSFRKVQELDIPPTIVIYFTDMITSDFGDDPGTPVLWACYDTSSSWFKQYASKAPFGTQIHIT